MYGHQAEDDRDSFIAPYYYSSDRPVHLQPIIPCSSNLLKNAAAMRDSCSDSDSGICADNNSDGQLSPRRPPARNPPPPPPRKPQFVQPLPPYPFNPSQSDRCQNQPANQNFRSRITPLIPHNSRLISHSCKTNNSTTSSGRSTNRSTPLRVRFADEVSIDTSSTTSRSSPSPSSSTSTNPPLYDDACKRINILKHNRQQHTQHEQYCAPSSSRSHVRSQSLPRNSPQRVGPSYIPTNHIITAPQLSSLSSAKSIDSLVDLAPGAHAPRPANPCVLPAGSCDDIIRLDDDPLPPPPQFDNCSSFHSLPRPSSRQAERSSRFDSTFSHYLGKVRARGRSQQRTRREERQDDRAIRATPLEPEQQPAVISKSSSDYSFDRQIRVRLLGLDHRGIHVLQLEKLHPGPFGFYISTGVYKRKKGIFVSRVTASCLVPLLTVGDQILEVDSEPVKGKNLEQVQLMIADKTKIILKLFPVIMR